LARTPYTLVTITQKTQNTHQKKGGPIEISECKEEKYKNAYLAMENLEEAYMDPPLGHVHFLGSLRAPHHLLKQALHLHSKKYGLPSFVLLPFTNPPPGSRMKLFSLPAPSTSTTLPTDDLFHGKHYIRMESPRNPSFEKKSNSPSLSQYPLEAPL